MTSESSAIARTNQDEVATAADPTPNDELAAMEGPNDEVMPAMEPPPTVDLDALDGHNSFSDTEEEPTPSWSDGDFFTTD